MIEVEASRAATAARLEGAAFGGWITSDVPLPLAGPSGAAPRLSLQVREGRPYRRWPGDLPLARLGAVPAIEGDVSPSSGTVWLRPTSAGPGVVWGAVLGLALPHVAHACGTHVLHASCVSRGCRAVAFLGGPRSGKSSAAAALVRRGWRLVSDDALPVTAGFDGVLAQPAFPAIRLFTPMATWFAEGDPGRMLPVHPRLQKWWAHVDQARQWHGSEPVPLRCLCLLDRSGQPGGRLPGSAAVMTVLGASYQPPEAARATRARAFETAHALAAAVPVVRLDLPRELPPPETLGGVVAARLDALGLP